VDVEREFPRTVIRDIDVVPQQDGTTARPHDDREAILVASVEAEARASVLPHVASVDAIDVDPDRLTTLVVDGHVGVHCRLGG